MENLRFKVINEIANDKTTVEVNYPIKVTTVFAENVFTFDKARNYLTPEAYKSFKTAVEIGTKIDRKIANSIATGLRAWCEQQGVTHFTHWFQPLTNTTAEKHDSFFTLKPDGSIIEQFDGDALIQQEPDASSFPNGGLRSTFEARGYTAWDPSSPPFILKVNGGGKTLFIPTIFVAYTGESLDYKAPLLKSTDAIQKISVQVAHYFDRNISRVTPTLGWEQEYFVIDERLANLRPDIVLSDRTLFGHISAKGQQLEDHYFGTIPERVYNFMRDFEQEAYRLGIPLKTRHNEVAPSQFECAPIFEEVNIAVDHNTLLMDIMNRTAKKHKLKVIFHEKPFAGINGSGKHCNWSMGTNTGVNLLSPGKTPKTNLMFLTFFVNVIKAVHDYDNLLRATIASTGNEHRLGANEAPPAIISIFIGKYLTQVLKEVEARVNDKFDESDEELLKLDIHNYIPEILLDNTDRNRTSPFAFTGNKFELRAVGSSANTAFPMTVLNGIVADTLSQFKKEVDALIEKGDKKEIAILHVIKQYITASKRILFEGDGYNEEWEEEAKKRGLKNVKSVPDALKFLVEEKAIKLFERNKILSKVEIEARYEIELEKYLKQIQIESRVIGDMSINHIVPASVKFQNILINNLRGLKEFNINPEGQEVITEKINKISAYIVKIEKDVFEMIESRKRINTLTEINIKAKKYSDEVKPFFDTIKYNVGKLEQLVDDTVWPLPKFREILFIK